MIVVLIRSNDCKQNLMGQKKRNSHILALSHFKGIKSIMRLKFFLTLVLPIALILSLAGGIISSQAAAENKKVVIGGTGGALGALNTASVVFMKDHPDIKVIVLGSLGSKGGIRALLSKKIDIAVATRPPKASENADNLISTPYAKTPVVFVTSSQLENLNFTMDEITQMFGKNKKWRNGDSIRPVVRPPASANTVMLTRNSKPLKNAIAKAAKWAQVAFSEQEAANELEQIKNSLGYLSLSVVMGENRILFVLNINGIKPWSENKISANYPFVKTFHMITAPEPKPAVQNFISFLSSPAGQVILNKAGQITFNSNKPD
jgi:phosphate transport system substrate-binding protein